MKRNFVKIALGAVALLATVACKKDKVDEATLAGTYHVTEKLNVSTTVADQLNLDASDITASDTITISTGASTTDGIINVVSSRIGSAHTFTYNVNDNEVVDGDLGDTLEVGTAKLVDPVVTADFVVANNLLAKDTKLTLTFSKVVTPTETLTSINNISLSLTAATKQ